MTTFLDHLRDALAPAYELGAELHGAGMSRVFMATDVALGRQVVVKVLPPELAAGVNRERFRREIQLAAQLQHPHIVPLLSAGEHGELLYYTMPFIEGESLRTRLERKAPFSVREVMRMLHDVVDALEYAHARGVIHRDIKPGNILTQGQHALVTDFGVAKALSAALPVSGMTSSGMAIGTPAYMAPEQLAADPAADQRVDIYAVGLLAYELLSGESPFVGPSPTATMAAQLTRDPAPLSTVRNDVPAALADIIMRCLAKAPENRPQTASALLTELEQIPIPSGPTTATRSTRAARSAGGRRSALIAGGLVVAAGIVALFASRTMRPRPPAPTATLTAPAPPAAPASAPAVAGTTGTQAGRAVLTREDSLAIARAVRERLSPTPSASSTKSRAAVDSGRAVATMDRRTVDSIVRASLAEWGRPGTGPLADTRSMQQFAEQARRFSRLDTLQIPMGGTGPRRVVITGPAESVAHPELTRIGTTVVGRLRDALRGRKEYRLADQNAVSSVLSRTREVSQVVAALGADIIASVDLVPVPGDSVVMLVKIRDPNAQPEYSYRVAGGRTIATSDLDSVLDPVIASAIAYIDEMAAAPRRATRVVVMPAAPTKP